MFSYGLAKTVGISLLSLGTAHYLYLLGPNKESTIAIFGVGCATACYCYCMRNETKGGEHPGVHKNKENTICESKNETGVEVIFFPDQVTIDSEMSAAPREMRGMMYKDILYKNANKEGAGLQKLRSRLTNAVKSIDVCLFNITSDQLTQSVVETIEKGVKVRLIIDGSAAESSCVKQFRAAGAFVRSSWKPESIVPKLSGDNTANGDYLMHHKFSIIDGSTLITGSFNWTMQALMGNNENIIITPDPELVHPFNEEFELLWKKFDPKAF